MAQRSGGVLGGAALLIAGAAVAAGSLLDWFTLDSGPIGFQGGAVAAGYTGMDTELGIVALVAGAVVALAGLWWISTRAPRWPSILSVLAGVAAAGVGIYELSRLQDAFVSTAASNAANDVLPAEKITDLLSRLITAGQASVSAGAGLYLVTAGGAVAVAVGLVGVVRVGRAPAPVVPASEATEQA